MSTQSQQRAPEEPEHLPEVLGEESTSAAGGDSGGWLDSVFSPVRALALQAAGGNAFANTRVREDSPAVPTPAPAPGPALPPPPVPTSTPTTSPTTPPPATATPTAEDNEKKVAEAVANVNGRMSYGLLDWAVTDEDARNSMNALNSLPPELQGKAVEKLDGSSFNRLLENLPEMDKASLASLVENTHDPERKLRLWAELEKGKGAKETAAGKKDEGHWYWQTDEQEQNEIDNKALELKNAERSKSVDAERDAGLKKLADGKLTEQDVKGIMANRVVADLTALPPEKQGESIKNMDAKAFDKLLTETPPADREKFKSLMENTTDPERKLKLWAEYHKSKVSNEAAADKKDEGTGPTKTADQLKAKDFNDQRTKIVDSNNAEVDDEVKVAMKALGEGKLTEQNVKDLIERKTREAEIERKYNVNMTNDFGKVANGTVNPATDRRTWTMKELDQISAAFDRMPPDQVTNNPALRTIRREAVRKDLDAGVWKDSTSTGADAGGGQIRVFDTGAGFDPSTGTNTAPDPWRTKKTSELAGHNAGGSGKNAELSLIEEVITHEAGHTVHQGDAALWTKWKDISGWENMNGATLKTRLMGNGMTEAQADAEIANMQAHREDHYGSRPSTNSGGKVYEVDPYSGNFLGVKDGAIPGGVEWGYAASNPEDHFAEFYAKAVHQPEALYQDMVDGPATAVKDQEKLLKDQNDKIAAMKAGGASAADIQAEEAKLPGIQSGVDKARATAETRKKQWDFFRTDVFKTDSQDIQALNAPPGKEAIYDEYKKKATMCQTPQQLANLREAYKNRL